MLLLFDNTGRCEGSRGSTNALLYFFRPLGKLICDRIGKSTTSVVVAVVVVTTSSTLITIVTTSTTLRASMLLTLLMMMIDNNTVTVVAVVVWVVINDVGRRRCRHMTHFGVSQLLVGWL